MNKYFPAAPLSLMTKIISTLGSVMILTASYLVYLDIPATADKKAHALGYFMVVLLAGILPISLLFMVRGYTLTRTHLYIHRLLWRTEIPLPGLKQVEFVPEKLKGSLRLFGNGGLFSYTGLYYNKKLGRYRLFASDFSCAVTLFLEQKTLVISPEQPQAFVRFVQVNLLKTQAWNFDSLNKSH